MATTPNLGLAIPIRGDEFNHILFNETVLAFEVMRHTAVTNRVNTEVGLTKTEGVQYVISNSPTGSFGANYIIACYGGQWRGFAPWEGWRIYNLASAQHETYNGSAWLGNTPS